MKKVLCIIFSLSTFACFGENTKVTRVIDGDTFETETGLKVRLIGINAPEITDIFGYEAKKHLIELVEGQTVDLEPDHLSKGTDKYNRLLRYVILNGIEINKQMIADGFAFAYLKYHFDREAEYKQAQLIAKLNFKGIWGDKSKEEIVKEQNTNASFWSTVSLRAYIIAGLVFILLCFGIYFYFKK